VADGAGACKAGAVRRMGRGIPIITSRFPEALLRIEQPPDRGVRCVAQRSDSARRGAALPSQGAKR